VESVPSKPFNGRESPKYWAFISYRHADNQAEGRQWATWLHQQIETYEVPSDLIGTTNNHGDVIPERIFPIFRDEEELPADADLAAPIYRALDSSRVLIVICSPRSVASTYVSNEIRYFKQLGRSNRVLAAIIEGEPNASWDKGKQEAGIPAEAECFPEALRHPVDERGELKKTERVEPIAADFRINEIEQGWTSPIAYRQFLSRESKLSRRLVEQKVAAYREGSELARLKILAGILGVPLGTLTQRDRQYQIQRERRRARIFRRVAAAMGLLLVVAIGGGVFAWTQYHRALERRRENLKQLHDASMAEYATAAQRIDKDGKWHEGVGRLARALDLEPGNRFAAIRLYETILRNLALQRDWPIATPLKHDGAVISAMFTPDGTKVVTASVDHTVRVWDATTWQQIGEPIPLGEEIDRAVVSPDGKKILTVPINLQWRRDLARLQQFADGAKFVEEHVPKAARVWNLATRQPLGVPLQHNDEILSGVFSTDSTKVLTASADKTARVWDAKTGQPIGSPLTAKTEMKGAIFSPDGSKIFTWYQDGAQIWDAKNGHPIGSKLDYRGETAVFSHDSTKIAIASFAGGWSLCDARSGKVLGGVSIEAAVSAVDFSPDDNFVAAAINNNTARIYDAGTLKEVGEPMRHDDMVSSANFSPDGTKVVTLANLLRSRRSSIADKNVRIWDAATGKELGEPLRHPDVVIAAAFSPDGARIVTASTDGSARVWATPNRRPAGAVLRFSIQTINVAVFDPAGRKILTADQANTSQIWDAETLAPQGKAIRQAGLPSTFSIGNWNSTILTWNEAARFWDSSAAAAFGANPNRIVSGDGKKYLESVSNDTVKIFDASNHQQLGQPLHHLGKITSAQFSSDGTKILTSSDDKTAQIWDSTTGKQIGPALKHDSAIFSARFSPDGTKIVTSSADRVAQIWDIATGQRIGKAFGYGDPIYTAIFSGEGNRVVATGVDATRVWDVASGQILGEPAPPSKCAVFSPDGSKIVMPGIYTGDLNVPMARVFTLASNGDLPLPVPENVRNWAHAVAGTTFDDSGKMADVSADDRSKAINASFAGSDRWSRLMRWTKDPIKLEPDLNVTPRQIAEHERDNETEEALQSALQYDPTVPLGHLILARFDPLQVAGRESDVRHKDFLREFDLARLPDDPALWLRAANELGSQNASKALRVRVATKATALSPNSPEAQRALADARSAPSAPTNDESANLDPKKRYRIEIMNKPMPGVEPNSLEGQTIVVLDRGRPITNYATMGYLLNEPLWSPDGRRVAVNNRRGNAGDYVWIFSLPDGKAIKKPDDDIGGKWQDAADKAFAAHNGNATQENFNRQSVTAVKWDDLNHLVVKVRGAFRVAGAFDYFITLDVGGNTVSVINEQVEDVQTADAQPRPAVSVRPVGNYPGSQQGTPTNDVASALAAKVVGGMSAGDIDSLVALYADRVDYLDKGSVSADVVRNEFRQYFEKWPQTSWQMSGPISSQPIENSRYRLTFPIAFDARNPATGKHASGNATETMVISQDSSSNWKIIYQRENIVRSGKTRESVVRKPVKGQRYDPGQQRNARDMDEIARRLQSLIPH
jgi:WD40 repeat protein